mgnify:FL=1|tara:strand:+ start:296 stop:760 length:465 start_codon:yes stop_codon:yes gene_type:complete
MMDITITKKQIQKFYKCLDLYSEYNVRVPIVEHETHVPLLYAITGTNLTSNSYKNKLSDVAYQGSTCFWVKCIDYRRVKEIRKQIITAMLKPSEYEDINIEIKDVIELAVPLNTHSNLTFPEKKKAMEDMKTVIPSLLKNAIDFEKKTNLFITS